MENYKEQFIRLYKENITREGSDKLLHWLESSDFFTAPASTRFHSAYEGGLVEHSVKAYYRFVQNLEMEYAEELEEKITAESIAIIALLHDVCKVNFYKKDLKNVKRDGVWVSEPYFTTSEKFPFGHGEKSVYIINEFMRLSHAEAIAINWHMGGFDQRVMGGSYSLSDAFYKFPIACLFHVSDLETTYLDEHPPV